ncbi:hypothetical protein FPOAC1_008641 [Fusarium poae]|uniref:hypothetical protein n=1 Tax=Fusarium poae TaxID=36050 RepID=UPI001CE91C31|nr:hypothetical protein FPOAC1_008641 [Fusarium poae]KAG8669252.1 hypothetical protein FPOAC1_008641 [Fusarium poae]
MNNNEENRNSTREYITITIEQSNNVEENNSEGIDIESQYVNALDVLAALAENSGVTPVEAVSKFVRDLDRKFNRLMALEQADLIATIRGEVVTQDRRMMRDYLEEALEVVWDLRYQAMIILRRM